MIFQYLVVKKVTISFQSFLKSNVELSSAASANSKFCIRASPEKRIFYCFFHIIVPYLPDKVNAKRGKTEVKKPFFLQAERGGRGFFPQAEREKKKNGKKKRKLDIDERGGLVVYFIKVFLYT